MLRKIVCFMIVFTLFAACKNRSEAKSLESAGKDEKNLSVFVSILPQKFFVEKIAGDSADVRVMVGPGHNPALYEPLPGQMRDLWNAEVYFYINVPFEHSWINRLKKNYPDLFFYDMSRGVEKIEFNSRDKHSHNCNDHEHTADPHVWTDPLRVSKMAENIFKVLSKKNPDKKSVYRKNLEAFRQELEETHQILKSRFSNISQKKFLVFHPSWSYFADRYGFEQISVEIDGKQPGTKTLSKLINRVKSLEIPVIFVQRQFDTAIASSVAEQTGIEVVSVDPLAYDYIANMKKFSEKILKYLSPSGDSP
ncbi:MAG: zinc ABC transporter substrate-binding protein [bacterium]